MNNLGIKEKNTLYPTMDNKKTKSKIIYPRVTLPLKLVGNKELNLNDEITIKVKGIIERVEKSKYYNEFTISAREGEIV